METKLKKPETNHYNSAGHVEYHEITYQTVVRFTAVIGDHARHLFNLLDNYGNLTRSGYDAQTAAIDSILARLNSGNYQDAITALGLATWVQELNAQNNLFKTYVEDTL
jgi:hypothetical protein